METNTLGNGTMNTATFEALRKAGTSEEQAVVLATVIPDGERLRTDMDRRFDRFEADMGTKFAHMEARIERRFNVLTWTLLGSQLGLGVALIGSLLGAIVTLLGHEPVMAFIQQQLSAGTPPGS